MLVSLVDMSYFTLICIASNFHIKYPSPATPACKRTQINDARDELNLSSIIKLFSCHKNQDHLASVSIYWEEPYLVVKVNSLNTTQEAVFNV